MTERWTEVCTITAGSNPSTRRAATVWINRLRRERMNGRKLGPLRRRPVRFLDSFALSIEESK